jgi:hypothetical protein
MVALSPERIRKEKDQHEPESTLAWIKLVLPKNVGMHGYWN